ncbi:MAG: Mut7-C RNAse domain-containing protein [Candidatus Marinimicrobia bacterium]|nr:Mut7-C RNAse domain-containing protein [Candidatus Neomarinimicrobiota bacterium]
MKFIADNMLGKLAKYLRALGYNCIYPPPENIDKIIEYIKKEDRIFITRSKKYTGQIEKSNIVILYSDKIDKQILELREKVKISYDPEKLFSRCLICNIEIFPVEKLDEKKNIPRRVFEYFKEFYKCPQCNRIYWMGGHTKRMTEKIEKIFKTLK